MTGRVPGKLLLFRMGSGLSVLLVEDTENTGSGLVHDGLAVFVGNVDAKFLTGCVLYVTVDVIGNPCRRLTTMSPDLSWKGSDSRPSPLSLLPLMNVPLVLLTSLM